MTSGIAGGGPPPSPAPTLLPSPEEIKSQLACGELPTGLRHLLPAYDGAARITGVRLLYEKHRRDSSSLILRLTLVRPTAPVAETRDLVLHYPRRASLSGPGTPSAWWYPADPYLPGLRCIARETPLLHQAHWETPRRRPWTPTGEYAMRSLQYNPGQRASFALTPAASAPPLMLKLVRPETFAAHLAHAVAIGASSLPHRIALPRLIAHSARAHAFLDEYLPGRDLGALSPDRLAVLRPALQDELIRIAGTIHQVALPPLPGWQSTVEIGKTRLLVDHVARRCPESAATLRLILARLARRFGDESESKRLVHGDFSARNLLYDERHSQSLAPGGLAVIDWDSAAHGPREKDIASLLSGRLFPSNQGLALLACYERQYGLLNRDLLNAFVNHQRLLKACRRYLLKSADEAFMAALEHITDQLEHNPLAE